MVAAPKGRSAPLLALSVAVSDDAVSVTLADGRASHESRTSLDRWLEGRAKTS